MKHFVAKHFDVDSGSHLPVLMKLLDMTKGDVLELGTGFYSTPYLHWACFTKKRKLVSYDAEEKYFEVAKKSIRDFHEIYFVENADWDKYNLTDRHWSIVFIDHSPGPRRKEEVRRLANHADYVVVHDTNGRNDKHYRFTEIYHLFKYRYDYNKVYPATTVLSNFKDLKELEDL